MEEAIRKQIIEVENSDLPEFEKRPRTNALINKLLVVLAEKEMQYREREGLS